MDFKERSQRANSEIQNTCNRFDVFIGVQLRPANTFTMIFKKFMKFQTSFTINDKPSHPVNLPKASIDLPQNGK